MISTKKLILYQTLNGDEPFTLWINALDRTVRSCINARIDRLECGNLRDWKRVGPELFEIRITFGAGYRIYFSFAKEGLIILLCGGDKGTQQKNIKQAQKYLNDYKLRY